MKCELCKRCDRLEPTPLCEACSEAITRLAGAQVRIEEALQRLKEAVQPKKIDMDEYRKAFGK
jgi:hypothetical protein